MVFLIANRQNLATVSPKVFQLLFTPCEVLCSYMCDCCGNCCMFNFQLYSYIVDAKYKNLYEFTYKPLCEHLTVKHANGEKKI